MSWEFPDRDTWHKVEARAGTWYMDRDFWCRNNCQGRWIMNRMTTEFENYQDAVAFALVWA